MTGQGTCQAGDDVCINFEHVCTGSGGGECYCWTSMSDETRCGLSRPISDTEDLCETDVQCAALFPDTPGVFCVKDTGDNCIRGGNCFAPCPL